MAVRRVVLEDLYDFAPDELKTFRSTMVSETGAQAVTAEEAAREGEVAVVTIAEAKVP